MFRIMTQAEIDESRRNLERVRKMRGLENQITAVLMDIEVGSNGFLESISRDKAREIVKVVKKLGYKK